jgi:hypothetical protein
LYSSNPETSQRKAAEATRAKFKLEKFSHSTVSRSFKTLEQTQKEALEGRFGEELKPPNHSQNLPLVSKQTTSGVKKENQQTIEKCFPTVKETACRRKEMLGFLRDFIFASKKGSIEAATCQFVKYWHEKTQRLLL